MVKTQSMIIVGLIFIAFAIPLVQSLELIAGDNISIKFSGVVKNCVILNNHSNLDGLNLTESGKYVYLIIDLTYKPDNFTIQCDVAGVKEERSGGGSGRIDPFWKKPIVLDTNKSIIINETKDGGNETDIGDKSDSGKKYVVFFIFVSLFFLSMFLVFKLILRKMVVKETENKQGEMEKI